ncbi:MAG: hypothetical protein CML06_20540 [Pseudomonadales bacterium]|nr:hypothetical protein [Pseudomonadales bacterium]
MQPGIGALRAALIVPALIVLTACDLLDDLPVGKAYAAKQLCSFVFTSGLDETLVREQFIKPKVQPLPWIWQVALDREAGSVRVGDILTAEDQDAVALYQDGRGCTLLVDQPATAITHHSIEPLAAPVLDPARPWPHGAGGPAPPVVGVDYQQLQAAIDRGFAEREAGTVLTHSVLVAWNGQLLAEQYALGVDAQTPLPGWSMTKTITGTLAGILVGDGVLALDAPAPVPQWQDTKKANITLRHLLQMTSGLEVNEDYGGFSDVTQMLYRESNQYAYALRQPVVTAPNVAFEYSTAETNRLGSVIQAAGGAPLRPCTSFINSACSTPWASPGAWWNLTPPDTLWGAPTAICRPGTGPGWGSCTCRKDAGRAAPCCQRSGWRSPPVPPR